MFISLEYFNCLFLYFSCFFYINFDLGRNNQVKRTRKLLGGVTREPIPEGITEIPLAGHQVPEGITEIPMEGKPCKKNPIGKRITLGWPPSKKTKDNFSIFVFRILFF